MSSGPLSTRIRLRGTELESVIEHCAAGDSHGKGGLGACYSRPFDIEHGKRVALEQLSMNLEDTKVEIHWRGFVGDRSSDLEKDSLYLYHSICLRSNQSPV